MYKAYAMAFPRTPKLRVAGIYDVMLCKVIPGVPEQKAQLKRLQGRSPPCKGEKKKKRQFQSTTVSSTTTESQDWTSSSSTSLEPLDVPARDNVDVREDDDVISSLVSSPESLVVPFGEVCEVISLLRRGADGIICPRRKRRGVSRIVDLCLRQLFMQ